MGISDLAVVVSGDGGVRIINDAGATVRQVAGASGFLHAAGISADGGVVAIGGQAGVLAVWKDLASAPVMSFASPSTGGGSAR